MSAQHTTAGDGPGGPAHFEELAMQQINRQSGEAQPDNPPSTAEEPMNIALLEDIPPNGGYGWVCAACVFLINAHTWGINSAWGVFLAHYLSKSTFPSATLLQYALIGGLSISQALMISPLISISKKQFGTMATLLIGTVLEFLALFGASYATEMWHLFLSQGVLFGWGIGFLYVTATALLPPWFSTRRSLAIGLATSGAGLGGLAYNLAAGKAIETLGLGWTYRMLAFCSLGANLFSSILLKDRNKAQHTHNRVFDFREYGHFEVVLVILWGIVTEFGYITLLYSLPDYASSIGLSATQGSITGAILNLGLGIGRPFVGLFSDRFGRINVAAFMTVLCGIFCLTLWVPAKSYALLLTFALLAGTVAGTFWSTVGPVTVEVVGLGRLPSTFGLICVSLVLPTTFAEPVALSLVSATGYLQSQIFVACMFLLGGICLWVLRSWKIYEVERKSAIERSDVLRLPSYFSWLRPRKLFLPARV